MIKTRPAVAASATTGKYLQLLFAGNRAGCQSEAEGNVPPGSIDAGSRSSSMILGAAR